MSNLSTHLPLESLPSRERFRGTVVWFSSGKGFGFIKPEDVKINGGKDVFVHFYNIVQKGFKTLRAGDVVEFFVGENKNGMVAIDVKIIEEAR